MDMIALPERYWPTNVQKARSAERARLEALLKKYEKPVRSAFMGFVRTIKSDAAMSIVSRYLERGQLKAALKFVDSHVIKMASVLASVFTGVGKDELPYLRDTLGVNPVTALSFDPTDPASAALMQQNQLEFVTEFSNKQRAVTSRALQQGLREGLGTVETANLFKHSIGLTVYQQDAVESYHRLLAEGSSEALQRALRDRRFDPTVQQAIDDNDLLSHSQMDRMVEAYRRKALALRAETIARTETHKIVEQSRDEATRQVVEQIEVPTNRIKRVWNATLDRRTRDTHALMDGQVVGMKQPFTSPSGAKIRFPGDPKAPPGESINCRCTVSIRVTS